MRRPAPPRPVALSRATRPGAEPSQVLLGSRHRSLPAVSVLISCPCPQVHRSQDDVWSAVRHAAGHGRDAGDLRHGELGPGQEPARARPSGTRRPKGPACPNPPGSCSRMRARSHLRLGAGTLGLVGGFRNRDWVVSARGPPTS